MLSVLQQITGSYQQMEYKNVTRKSFSELALKFTKLFPEVAMETLIPIVTGMIISDCLMHQKAVCFNGIIYVPDINNIKGSLYFVLRNVPANNIEEWIVNVSEGLC